MRMLYSLKCEICGATADNVKGQDDASVNVSEVDDDAEIDWHGSPYCDHADYIFTDSEPDTGE